MKKTLLSVAVMTALVFANGCMDITGRGPAPLAKTIGESTERYSRVGHVYCMRGWLGIFSTGMDALADEIDKQVGVPSVSVADEEWRRLKGWLIQRHEEGKIQEEPLVLLGHSWGADDMIRVCGELKAHGISVDLLVLIDPVTPPLIPNNVKKVYCVYKSHPVTDTVPFWRGVSAAVEDKATPIVNIDLRTMDVGFDTAPIDHINIEKNEGVHHMVMEQIRQVCPERVAWEKEHGGATISQRPVKEKTAMP